MKPRAFSPVRVTGPADWPVSLDEVKAQARYSDDDEDALFGALIETAIAWVDGDGGILGRCLINQTWRQDFSGWPESDVLLLPFPNVSAVTVTYTTDGASTEFAASNYALVEMDRGSAVIKNPVSSWPTHDDIPAPVRVQVTAGYGASPSDVPAAIRHALKIAVSTWFDNRNEYVVGTLPPQPLPLSTMPLLEQFRRVGI